MLTNLQEIEEVFKEDQRKEDEVWVYNWRKINKECFERDRSTQCNNQIVERRNQEWVKIRVHNLLKK